MYKNMKYIFVDRAVNRRFELPVMVVEANNMNIIQCI